MSLFMIKRQLNASAGTYKDASVLQREVADRLLERLDYMRVSPGVILEVGAATGYVSQRLQKRYPKAHIVPMDLAMERLALHPKSWFKSGPSRLCADSESLPLRQGSVDLIFSNLSLAQLNDPHFSIQEWFRVLKPGGLLLYSTLGPDTLQELRKSFQAVDSYPHTHEFIDMHHLGDLMLSIGWRDPVMDMELVQFSYRALETLIKDLKDSGAANLNPVRLRGLMTSKKWKQMEAEYGQFQRENGQFPATFEVIYGHAYKGEESALRKMNEDGEVVIPVSVLKRGVG